MFNVVVRFTTPDINTGEYGIETRLLKSCEDLEEAFEFCADSLGETPQLDKSFNIEQLAGGLAVAKCSLKENPLYQRIMRGGELLIVDTEATLRSILETRLMDMEQSEVVDLVVGLLEHTFLHSLEEDEE